MKKIIVTNKLLLLAPALVFCFLSCEEYESNAKLVIKNNSTRNITIETVKAWEATDEFLEYRLQAIRCGLRGDILGVAFAEKLVKKEEERIFSTPPLHEYTVHISPGEKKAFDVKKEKTLLIRVNDKYKEDIKVGSTDSVLVLKEVSTDTYTETFLTTEN